jgi:hypothetical protein
MDRLPHVEASEIGALMEQDRAARALASSMIEQ